MPCKSIRFLGQWGELSIGLSKVLGLGYTGKRGEEGSQKVREYMESFKVCV